MADEPKPAATATAEAPAASPGVTMIWHRACSECQMIKEALEKDKVKVRLRDIYDQPLSREELLVLLDGTDVKSYLNPRAGEYRDRRMAMNTPSVEAAAELISRDGRLLRCPILLKGAETFPVIIESDAAALPPEMWKFVGVEKAVKRAAPPGGHAKAAAAAKAAAPAAKPAASAPASPEAPTSPPPPAAEPPKA